MPFSRGLNCGPDPRQGPSGGLKIRIFHPHDFTKTLFLKQSIQNCEVSYIDVIVKGEGERLARTSSSCRANREDGR